MKCLRYVLSLSWFLMSEWTRAHICHSCGVNVPGIRMVDAAQGVLGIEWIDGKSVRFLLGGGEENEEILEEGDVDEPESEDATEEDTLSEYGVSKGEAPPVIPPTSAYRGVDEVMQMIGTEIAKMHMADIIHGDLTTSNMMLRRPNGTNRANLVSAESIFHLFPGGTLRCHKDAKI